MSLEFRREWRGEGFHPYVSIVVGVAQFGLGLFFINDSCFVEVRFYAGPVMVVAGFDK